MSSALRLLVAYDGTAFHGYQIQPGERTVQGVLEDALSTLSGRPVRVRAAGRTDAGVHALGQVVSVPPLGVDAGDVLRAASSLLPADVSIVDAQSADPEFDARVSALWRSYTYLLWTADAPHPMFRRFALWVKRPVDVDALNDALSVVRGTHDFRSFARVRDDQSPVRTVVESAATADGPVVRITVAGESFLHQMVRSIVGSALEVATGRRSGAWMREVLISRSRAAAGSVAPAHGLTLTDVGYEHAPWPRRADHPWPWASPAAGTSQQQSGGLQ